MSDLSIHERSQALRDPPGPQDPEIVQSYMAAKREVRDIIDRFGVDESQWPAGQLERAQRMVARGEKLYDGMVGKWRSRMVEIVRDPELRARHTESVDTRHPFDRSGQPSEATDDPWQMRSGALAQSPQDLRGRALAAVERTEAPDGGRAMLAEMIERYPADHDETTLASRWAIATSDPAYRSAFVRLLRDPMNGHRGFSGRELEAFQRAEMVQRSLTIGDGTGAGFMAPFTIDPSWQLTSSGEIDPVRELARVVTIAGYEWRGVSTAGVTAHWRAEAGESDDDTPTLAQPVVHPERADTFVPFSFEAQEDATELEAQIRMAMADAKAVLEANAWISGLGHSNSPPQPEGIVTGINSTASEVAPTTAEVYAAADVPKLLKAVPPRFRANTTVLMDYATYLTTRNFTPGGSTTLAPYFNEDETRLLGKPWREATALRSTDDINAAQTADNYVLLAGDFQRGYTIVDRVGLRVELVPHLLGANRRPTGERGLFAYWRTSGGVTNVAAIRGLNVATTA